MKQLEVGRAVDGRRVTLAPRGVINTDTVSVFTDALASLDYSGLDLTLDCSGLEYITSVGLRALLVTRRKLAGDTMRLVHVNAAVYSVLEVSGFLSFFPVVPDTEDAALPLHPSFRQYLSYRVKTNPYHLVFHSGKRSYSWIDLDEASQIVAGDFFARGVRKGTHVGMFARNSVNWVVAFFAAQKLGAIVALLNYSLKPEELRTYSRYGDITFLCFDLASAKTDAGTFRESVTGPDSRITDLYDISEETDFLSRKNELPALRELFTEEYDSDDPCVMIFTSGSTGKPKGILSSSNDRLVNTSLMNREIRPDSGDRACLCLPLCHVFGFGSGLNTAVLYDTPVYMSPGASAAALLDTISVNGCTLFNAVPTILLSMVRSGLFTPEKVRTLRACVFAGSAITEAQVRLLKEKMPHVHFMGVYGMSEMSPISMTAYDDTLEHLARTVGKPVGEVTVEIRDHATGEKKAAGAEGEIVIRSFTSLTCYYGMDLDQQAIDDEGWIATGDLGFLDGEGYLHLTGRCKDLIIRGGENISPKEIEEVVTRLDGIHDVRIVGVPDEHYGEIVAAAVVMRPGKAFSREQVESYVLGHLARYKAPEYYVLYDAFPLLSNGKIDMVSLKKDVASRRGSGSAL